MKVGETADHKAPKPAFWPEKVQTAHCSGFMRLPVRL